MVKKSDSVKSLTRCFASIVDPTNLTLVQIDRLYNVIDQTLKSYPSDVDVMALDDLATDLDFARRRRRLVRSGHVPGQLTMDGSEVPY